MSEVSLKCVFCRQETCEKNKKFTPEIKKKSLTVLEYRQAKPVRRKSSNAYATVEISNDTSLNDGYHVQCYKLFTAIKVPSDFQGKNKIPAESAQECNDAPEVAAKSPELSISSTSTIQTAGTTVDDFQKMDGKLEPSWFVGNQLPETYEHIVITPDILGDTSDSETQGDEEIDHEETNFEYESSEDED